MRFGAVVVDECEGAVVAHTHRLPGRIVKKGRRLSTGDLAAFSAAGHERIIVAQLEEGDVLEDEAATALAQPLIGPHVRADEASTGRVNLFATDSGLASVDHAIVEASNMVDEALDGRYAASFIRRARR